MSISNSSNFSSSSTHPHFETATPTPCSGAGEDDKALSVFLKTPSAAASGGGSSEDVRSDFEPACAAVCRGMERSVEYGEMLIKLITDPSCWRDGSDKPQSVFLGTPGSAETTDVNPDSESASIAVCRMVGSFTTSEDESSEDASTPPTTSGLKPAHGGAGRASGAGKNAVSFSAEASGRWIVEVPLPSGSTDEITDVALKTNFSDRYSSRETVKTCSLRAPGEQTHWDTPGFSKAAEDKKLDISIMGSCVTFTNLLLTVLKAGDLVPPHILECSKQQVLYAAIQSIFSHLSINRPRIDCSDKEIISYTEYLADMFVLTLDEYDAGESKNPSLKAFIVRFIENIRDNNTTSYELTCETFLDLIKKSTTTELTREIYLDLIRDLDSDRETKAEVTIPLEETAAEESSGESPRFKAVTIFTDVSRKYSQGNIPFDVLFAPEFDSLHAACLDRSWGQNEERRITLTTCPTRAMLSKIVLAATDFCEDGMTRAFLYATRGIC